MNYLINVEIWSEACFLELFFFMLIPRCIQTHYSWSLPVHWRFGAAAAEVLRACRG